MEQKKAVDWMEAGRAENADGMTEARKSGADMGAGDMARRWIRGLYERSGWLTVTGFLMLADVVLSISGLLADPSVVDGAPTWLKPFKFAVSTSLFVFTLAFVTGRLTRVRRFAVWLGRIMAVALVLEIALIDMQAARHTASHFNRATSFDAAVYGAMGLTIAVVFLSTALLCGACFLERFKDRALGWAVRLGLLLALAGMGVGALMTLPTPQQLAAAHAGGEMRRVGAHTVGAADGGRALPVTGWSADHGDLRIAHFLGLHAMQVLLLAWWASSRSARWGRVRQLRLVGIATGSWAMVFGLVLWQALRGESLLRLDGLTVGAWAACLAVTAAGFAWIAGANKMEEMG